jgi:hypothetical protein
MRLISVRAGTPHGNGARLLPGKASSFQGRALHCVNEMIESCSERLFFPEFRDQEDDQGIEFQPSQEHAP